MKQTEMIALALAGIAVYLIVKGKGSTTTTKGSTGSTGAVGGFVGEIFDAAGQAFGNGWRYFDNGTSIDPNGNYYFNGQPVWSAGTNYV